MELQTAKGVRDIPPEEKALKNKVVNTLTEVFELYGFAPLETPILERYETLAAKFAAGEASDALKETFTLADQGDRKLGLRFDLTVPLARFMAMNPMLKMPFKRYEVGQVFRDGPIKLGRVRQFTQCDFDIVGSDSMLADAEILAVVEEGFKKLGLDIVIKVNSRKLINGILEQAGISRKEEALISVDKLDKIGKEGVVKELKEKGFTTKQIQIFFSLIEVNDLKKLKSLIKENEALEGIAELEELFLYCEMMSIKSAVFDISLARGLAYYTGTVFEAYLKSKIITSSLAAGGRWDNMIGKFMDSKDRVAAVGGSFGLIPIMEVMKVEKPNKDNTRKGIIYIVPIDTIKKSLEIAQKLRQSDIPVSFSLSRKVSKSLEYANKLGIKYVILIGEDELSRSSVNIRNMETGLETNMPINKLTAYLKRELR